MSESGSLLDRINKLIESDKIQLPIFNQVTLRLREIVASKNYDVTEIERMISQDQALAADVLRAANSPFYCGLMPIRTIHTAIVRLGTDQVTRLVMLASQYSKHQAKDARLTAMLQELWRHSSSTAMAAQWLAKRLRSEEIQEECFLGGLLHDIGQLLILKTIDEINSVEGGIVLSPPLIREVLEAAHSQLGHNLLRHWNIPEIYCRITLLHHSNEFDPTETSLLIVRLANEASRKLQIGLNPDPSLALSATPEALALKASDVLLAELEIMLEDNIGTFLPATASSARQPKRPKALPRVPAKEPETGGSRSVLENNW